jgi:hypothetical protein
MEMIAWLRESLLICAFLLTPWCSAEVVELFRLAPPEIRGLAGNQFGASVAISEDVAVVAAPEYEGNGKHGAAFVYSRRGEEWQFDQVLFSPHPLRFGLCAAVHQNRIVVSGEQRLGSSHPSGSGLAFVFENVGGNWIQTAELFVPETDVPSKVANSVAIRGRMIVVGADEDTSGGILCGAAYVFEQNAGGWQFQQKLLPLNPAHGASFGNAIALGDDVLAIAASGDLSYLGTVYLFGRSTGAWTLREQVVAPDALTGAVFGASVALADDLLVVGRTHDHQFGRSAGAAYVFQLLPKNIQFLQKLGPSIGQFLPHFGCAAGIDGDRVFVGASNTHIFETGSLGTVYIFRGENGQFMLEDLIVPSKRVPMSGFGWSLAVNDGTLLVGAPFQDANGMSYIFGVSDLDTEPPVIHRVIAKPSIISPPNNKLVPVRLNIIASDDSGALTSRIKSVRVDDASSIRKMPTFQITGGSTLLLRAERNSRGRPRTYMITIECADSAGNTSEAVVAVRVR